MKSKPDWIVLVLLGLSHGLSDCSAGFLIGNLGQEQGLAGAGGLLLLYNVIAFGGQLPFGVVIDRVGRFHGWLLGSVLLMMAALAVQGAFPGNGSGLAAVTLAGLASAVFHAAGGGIAQRISGGSASAAGVFAGPGVLGLAFGGWMAWQGIAAHGWLAAGMATAMGLIALRVRGRGQDVPAASAVASRLDGHDLMMILVLLAIAMRSAVWNVWEQLMQGDYAMLFAVAMAASTGKIAGGLAAGRVGLRNWILAALVLASPLLTFGQGRPWLFLPGIALLQSATGPTLSLLWRVVPSAPATAAGMGFGFAIAAGGLPFLLGWDLDPIWAGLLPLPVAAMIWLVFRWMKPQLPKET